MSERKNKRNSRRDLRDKKRKGERYPMTPKDNGKSRRHQRDDHSR